MNAPDAELFTTLLMAVVFCLLSFCWWIIGSLNERKHLKSLFERETAIGDFPLTSLKRYLHQTTGSHPPQLVSGEAVIASDAFKTLLFGFRNLIGGESRTFSRLYERARREALLRMIARAKAQGYDAICNVRFDASDIGGNACGKKNQMPMAVCLVSGTAYRRSNDAEVPLTLS